MAYEVIEGKIAMDLIKPVSVQGMWLARAMGESAFRLILLTAPTAIIVTLLFPVLPPASKLNFVLFLVAAVGSFFIMGALNFIIGTCAIPLTSILALIRAKFWLIELLSGLLIPLSFFPRSLQIISSWLPFEHIANTPLQIYLGRLSLAQTLRLLAIEYFWVAALHFSGSSLVDPRHTQNHHSRRLTAIPMRDAFINFKRHAALLGSYFAQYAKVRVSYRGDFFISAATSMTATIFSLGFVFVLFSAFPLSPTGAWKKSCFSTASR